MTDTIASFAPVQNGHYIRFKSDAQAQVEKALEDLYTTEKVFPESNVTFRPTAKVLCSGVNSSSTVLQSIYFTHLKTDKPFVFAIADEIYHDTNRIVEYLKAFSPPGKFTLERFTVSKRSSLEEIFRKHGNAVAALYFEDCSNPSSQMFDFSILPSLKKISSNCLVHSSFFFFPLIFPFLFF